MNVDANTAERVRAPGSLLRVFWSTCNFLEKETHPMQDQDKKAHAMTSFALFGGLFGSPRGNHAPRNVSRPEDFKPYERK